MSGFDNENIIWNELNNKSFDELNDNLKNIIMIINNNQKPLSLSSKKYAGTNKADIAIIIDKKEHLISIKKGSGNSIHQEPIEDFISYLKIDIEDNKDVFNDLRHFIWGDFTLDGSGDLSSRMNANQYKKKFPNKVQNIQKYFNKHKNMLIERFIVLGSKSKKKPDFLLYGDIFKCKLVSEDKLVNYAISIEKKPISIGVLTFQAWNRNINGGNKSEKKRGQIQLKWGGLKSDIEKI